MKIRTDFVTNSSSSSYICEICNEVAAGYDLSLSDTDMVVCNNGHTFCIDHLKKYTEDTIKVSNPIGDRDPLLISSYDDIEEYREECDSQLINANVIKLYCYNLLDFQNNLSKDDFDYNESRKERIQFYETAIIWAQALSDLYQETKRSFYSFEDKDLDGFIPKEVRSILLKHLYNLDDIRDNYPIEFCPICQLDIISDANLIKYLLKELKIEKINLLDKLKKAYNHNYSSFIEDLSNKRN